jgi:hypothetical protein
MALLNGDQIGQIFANWGINYFWRFLLITEVTHIFGLLFSSVVGVH